MTSFNSFHQWWLFWTIQRKVWLRWKKVLHIIRYPKRIKRRFSNCSGTRIGKSLWNGPTINWHKADRFKKSRRFLISIFIRKANNRPKSTFSSLMSQLERRSIHPNPKLALIHNKVALIEKTINFQANSRSKSSCWPYRTAVCADRT